MKKYTLITGGASGLGLELSKRFTKDKNDLVLISSNINNLNSAKEMLEKEYGVEVKVLALDLSDNKNFPLVKEFVEKNGIKCEKEEDINDKFCELSSLLLLCLSSK